MSDSSAPLSERTMGTARRLWGLVYVRAAAYLVVGVMLFVNPDGGLQALKWLVAIAIAAQGILLTLEGQAARTAKDDGQSWRLVAGIVSIVAAALIVFWPSMTGPAVMLLVGVWACVAGVLGVVAGLRGRVTRNLAWDWQLVNAVLWIVLGIAFLTRPTDDIVTIALLLGLYLVMAGAVLAVGGLSTTTRQKDLDRRGTARGDDTARPAAQDATALASDDEPPPPA
ncbi:HdeD family acid-resistance protein [Isoptericola jiangsuensis]|uniref:HdeD family acid-resistance protein n=1 Tax=Isoptericola jiangsuensis TaxID=548579 RepID=UPI003AAE6AE8